MTAEDKLARYRTARALAQSAANESGYDYGLEYNSVFFEYRVFLLPARQHRSGHELRCEVVMPERIERQKPGHGFA